MKIKKAYTAIVELLEANKDATVASVLDQVKELAAAKVGTGGGGKASTFHRDDETGQVLAVFDYYFKKWMSPLVVSFGAKATSASGLNNMCKEGVSNWTAARRKLDQVNKELLPQLMSGEITPAEAEQIKATAEAEAAEIKPHSEGYGFDSLEECLEDLATRGLV